MYKAPQVLDQLLGLRDGPKLVTRRREIRVDAHEGGGHDELLVCNVASRGIQGELYRVVPWTRESHNGRRRKMEADFGVVSLRWPVLWKTES